VGKGWGCVWFSVGEGERGLVIPCGAILSPASLALLKLHKLSSIVSTLFIVIIRGACLFFSADSA